MLEFQRVLSNKDITPYNSTQWETTPVRILAEDGRVVYECSSAEFPATWSETARNIACSKYFRESRNSKDRETSVKTMVERVVSTITNAGIEREYFSVQTAEVFADELRMILLTQRASFNSPVWFSCGIPGGPEHPVLSACFINSVEDNLQSIMELAQTEATIYAAGGGSGVNFSKLRASHEPTKGGGVASGPISFMHIYDAVAGIIKSGGRTRRSAKLCLLNIDHPDICAYIDSKADQESLVELLVAAGMSPKFDDPNGAYAVAAFQNENHSVRLTDTFMKLVRETLHSYREDFDWDLINRVDGKVARTVSGKNLFRQLAAAAHKSGDPGVMFHDTINRGNTCAIDGEIIGSNPCAEFSWHDDSACNLASLNLDRFLLPDQSFDIKLFRHVVRVLVTAMDLIVDIAGYPTNRIAENTAKYRPLGLGFTNLGGMLLSLGVAYSSETGRDIAAAVTCLMTAQAYLTSAELAGVKGPFLRFTDNRVPMEEVLGRHVNAARALKKDILGVHTKALSVFREAVSLGFGKKQDDGTGYRNAQVSLVPPAGTVSLLMDACTTGLEPPYALKTQKRLIEGRTLYTFNRNVEKALVALGYEDPLRSELLAYCTENGHFEGSRIKDNDLPVFDCSIPIKTRCLSIDAHLDMVAAISPHISGAASKTFNLPHEASIRDIELTFLRAWEKQIKCIAIYRGGSKMSEPLRVKEVKEKAKTQHVPQRMRLPDDVEQAPRHKFSVGSHTGYLHVGLHPETKQPIEIFIRLARFGSTVGGVLDNYGVLMSKALQFGIPLDKLVSHMIGSKFPPSGFTINPDIRTAGSILDYLGRYLQLKYLGGAPINHVPATDMPILPEMADDTDLPEGIDGETCPECGSFLQSTGACRTCTNCAFSSGVCG